MQSDSAWSSPLRPRWQVSSSRIGENRPLQSADAGVDDSEEEGDNSRPIKLESSVEPPTPSRNPLVDQQVKADSPITSSAVDKRVTSEAPSRSSSMAERVS